MSVVIAAASATVLDPVTRDWVNFATDYSSFAGPDGHAARISEKWGLGHALLRLGTTHVVQPITLDGRTWLSADARLDDRRGVIAALGGRGQRADAEADDAELLLRAYAAWGERSLDHLAGDFAFVLWDDARRELLCACDQIGVLSLYYATVHDTLLIASSPEILLLHPGVSDRLDEGAIADFLLTGQGATFGPTTFAAIRRVPPAHVLRWNGGQPALQRYWTQPDFAPLLRPRNRTDYVERFLHLLERAVADRIAPGPLATQLSGGMDSTTITALAARLRERGGAPAGALRAVTGVLGRATGDQEGEYARLVADALGIEHDVIDESTLTPTDPLAPPRLVTPEPNAYQWSDLQYASIAIMASHARRCLTGLGADPLIGFIPWYWVEWLAKGRGLRLALSFADHVRLFRQRPQPHLRWIVGYLLQARKAKPPSVPALLESSFAARTDAEERLRRRVRATSRAWDKRMLSWDPAWQIWFGWGDPTYTRLPVRFSHPFVDLRLLDFAARVPPHPWFERKRILREATQGLLPEAIRQRPKTFLVSGPRTSATPQARRSLVELVEATPDAQHFLDTSALVDAILRPTGREWEDWNLARPLGLVHWLAHWKRPRAPRDGLGPDSRSEGAR